MMFVFVVKSKRRWFEVELWMDPRCREDRWQVGRQSGFLDMLGKAAGGLEVILGHHKERLTLLGGKSSKWFKSVKKRGKRKAKAIHPLVM